MAKNTKKAMSINGYYIEDLIDGYTTLDVSGRESHAGTLKTIEKFSDGNEWISRRYGGRTLTVSFVIQNGDNATLRHKLELLAGIIDVKNARAIFDDEPDKYFNVYLGENLSFSVVLGVATGTFDLYCADPFKYDLEETEVTVQTLQTYNDSGVSESTVVLVANNDGYKTYPRFEVNFKSDNGYMLFDKTNNLNFWNGSHAMIKAGQEYAITGTYTTLYFSLTPTGSKTVINPAIDFKTRKVNGKTYHAYVSDYDGYITATGASNLQINLAKPVSASIYFGDQTEKDTTTPSVTKNFDTDKNYTGWSVDSNVKMVSDTFKNLANTTVTADANGVHGNGYSTITTANYHGPVIIKDIGYNQSGDFNLKWYQRLELSAAKQAGCIQVMLLDSNKSPVFTYSISNNSTKNQNGTVAFYYRNDKQIWALETISLKSNTALNTHKETVNKKSTKVVNRYENYISRKGNTITVRSAADTSKILEFTESTKSTIRYIAFYFGKYNNNASKSADLTAPAYNTILGVEFTSASVDVSNKFRNGYKLEVDCNDMSVYRNGSSEPGLGDIGNDWLDMVIDHGTNYIACNWSDWATVAPIIKMFYRKRYI